MRSAERRVQSAKPLAPLGAPASLPTQSGAPSTLSLLAVPGRRRYGVFVLAAVLLLTLSACQTTPKPPDATPAAPAPATPVLSPAAPRPTSAPPAPAPTMAVDLAPLQGLPLGLAVNPDTVTDLAPYLGPHDIIKLTTDNLGLLAQLGQAQCALHLPRLAAYTPEALLAAVSPADLARCSFFTLSIEAHALPEADVADPATFLAGVRALADHFGKRLMVAVPTYRFVDSRGNFGGRRDLKANSGVDAARYADILIVEAQKSVDTPASFASLMRQVKPAARALNPHVQVWAMIGCAEGRCNDSLAAFAAALLPLATELDGIWLFYPPADPALARSFIAQLRPSPR